MKPKTFYEIAKKHGYPCDWAPFWIPVWGRNDGLKDAPYRRYTLYERDGGFAAGGIEVQLHVQGEEQLVALRTGEEPITGPTAPIGTWTRHTSGVEIFDGAPFRFENTVAVIREPARLFCEELDRRFPRTRPEVYVGQVWVHEATLGVREYSNQVTRRFLHERYNISKDSCLIAGPGSPWFPQEYEHSDPRATARAQIRESGQ